MNEVDNEAQQLIEAVKKSRTYLEYEKQKELLKQNPELKAQVDNYRAENFELQNSPDDGHLGERMEAFADRYADFIESPQVGAFLDAELNLCKMLQHVTNEIIGSLNFE